MRLVCLDSALEALSATVLLIFLNNLYFLGLHATLDAVS
jgi:hypothetical protein